MAKIPLKIVSTIVLICFILFPAMGQETEKMEQETESPSKGSTYKNVYLELLGASNLIGVSYDARIKPSSILGYRAGISYFYGVDYNSNDGHGFSVPLEFNCLLGKKRSKFEAAAGFNLGLYSMKETVYDYWVEGSGDLTIIHPTGQTTKTRNIFGYYVFFNIGYRYQRESGFMFRVGVSPSFNFGDRHGVQKKPILYPYISFGYTIK